MMIEIYVCMFDEVNECIVKLIVKKSFFFLNYGFNLIVFVVIKYWKYDKINIVNCSWKCNNIDLYLILIVLYIFMWKCCSVMW